jgi:hypothetical protein
MKCFVLMVFCSSIYFANGQKVVVHGIIKDSAKHIGISYATIKNLSADQTIFSDDKGQFSLFMETKGLLYITSIGYISDTIHYADFENDNLTINLKPFAKELQGVTVSGKALDQYQYDSIARRKQFIADGGMPTLKTAGYSNSGIGYALNLDKFVGPEKRKRKSYDFFKEAEDQDYIDFHFTPQFVHKYSGLTGDTLQKFMRDHRPEYGWLRKHHSDEDLKYYINDHLKLFFNRGDEVENNKE